jgi:hypothetical protein
MLNYVIKWLVITLHKDPHEVHPRMSLLCQLVKTLFVLSFLHAPTQAEMVQFANDLI